MKKFNFWLRSTILGVLLCFHANATDTQPSSTQHIDKYVVSPQAVGKTRLKVLFWDVYDAVLYASDGNWSADQPYALSLTYLRDFEGASIASRSIDELRDQGFEDDVKLATWFEQMSTLFPDVKKGETITGINDVQNGCHFYKDGVLLGTVKDPEFAVQFFNIWLSDKTNEPKMRRQLLGMR